MNLLQALCDAVRDWRDAKCIGFIQGQGETLACDGANHLENCPVELARQDLLNAHNKL
jgi:hypothetical protein